MSDAVTKCLTEIVPKTITSFRNMSVASAPIQKTDDSVKYWMTTDISEQTHSFSVLSAPTRKDANTPISAMHSCTWNLVTSRVRSFLEHMNIKL